MDYQKVGRLDYVQKLERDYLDCIKISSVGYYVFVFVFVFVWLLWLFTAFPHCMMGLPS